MNPDDPIAKSSFLRPGIRAGEIGVMIAVTAIMVMLSWCRWWPVSLVESWGFATGGACVWLVVREHVANWPVGLANNVLFFILFQQSRLYGDMWLQVIYFGLGLYGWKQWMRGGENQTQLKITRTPNWEWIVIAVALLTATFSLRYWLIISGGAAPFWDALTTSLSLAAQYLLCRKRLENWWFWIAADLIYIPLYLSRSLPLTAVLYAVFLVMCVIGFTEWRSKYRKGASI